MQDVRPHSAAEKCRRCKRALGHRETCLTYICVKELSVRCWPYGKGEKAAYLNLRKLLTCDLLRIRNDSDEISLRRQFSQEPGHGLVRKGSYPPKYSRRGREGRICEDEKVMSGDCAWVYLGYAHMNCANGACCRRSEAAMCLRSVGSPNLGTKARSRDASDSSSKSIQLSM